jgi:hypothetical protein
VPALPAPLGGAGGERAPGLTGRAAA